jgi:hypothetical protein
VSLNVIKSKKQDILFMKRISGAIVCLLFAGVSFAQHKTHHAAAGTGSSFFSKAGAMKDGVWGTILDAQSEPQADVEAMVYHQDTIVASGFTDANGHYATSPCKAGKYKVRIVFPNSNKYVEVNGVEIKKGRVMLDLKAPAPLADSTVAFAELQPKKKKDNKPGKH